MKWDCGPDWAEERERLENWHPHFALWPRRVATHDCRWLEWIERKGKYYWDVDYEFFSWEYRAKP